MKNCELSVHRVCRMTTRAAALLIVSCLLAVPCVQAAVEVQLARDGQAMVPIVLSDQASPFLHELAGTLTHVLTHMSGATFTVTTGSGENGVVLGVASNFPALAAGQTFAPGSAGAACVAYA